MVKTSLLLRQLLLVTFCVSLVVVTAMPQQRPARSRYDDDSDESCEGSHCSSSWKSRESSKKKTNSQTDRPRRPSSIDAGPAKHQQTSSTSILKSPGSILDQSDPALTGAACTTCIGDFDPAGRVGTTGTTTTGQVGADRSGSATTGAACATCTDAAVPATGTVGTTAGATIQTAGASADPLTGAACTTCTTTASGTAGKTAPIKTPSLTEAGRIRNPGSSAINPSNPSGQACTGTTCTAADPATVTAGTSGAIPPRKPSLLGEAGRIRNPGSAIQSDPASTGTPCTTCKTTGTAAGAVGTTSGTTINKTGGSSVADPSTGAASTGTNPIRKPIFGEAGRIRIPGSVNLSDPASTGTACTTCKTTGTATEAVGTTGTTPVKTPSSVETIRIRNSGSVNKTNPSATGAACTTCTVADPATGTASLVLTTAAPVRKTINLIDPARIRKPATQATGLTNCTTCTPGESSLVDQTSAVSDLVKKEADPSLIETAETAEIDPNTGEKMLSRFNTTVVKTVDHIHFNYDDPNKWTEHNSLCKGAHQSPIDIETRNTIVSSYPDISFFNYDKSYPENLENNGHTVQLSIDKLIKDLPYITGGGLDGLYQFAQLHFHWGEGLQGSEHTIDGKHYVAEAHIVHWDMKYGSFINATKHNDGLHVLGILIELQARDNIAFRHLEQFDKLTEAGCAKSDQLSYSVPLADLLPDSTSSFYRYAGSLTDARCNEDVIWTVFDTPIAISERQLAKFRLLTDEHGQLLTKNVRPTQLSHKRTVIYNPPSAPAV